MKGFQSSKLGMNYNLSFSSNNGEYSGGRERSNKRAIRLSFPQSKEPVISNSMLVIFISLQVNTEERKHFSTKVYVAVRWQHNKLFEKSTSWHVSISQS